MKKIALLLIVLCALFTVACAKSGEEVVSDSAVADSEEQLTPTRPETEVLLPGNIENENETSTDSLFFRFVRGEEALHFHQNNHFGFDNYLYDTEKGYNLEEILDVFHSNYALEENPKISYANLDLGDDGVEELAVKFTGMGIYGPGDDSELIYIIKEMNGMLELCYHYETWARSVASINHSGYFISGGSTSATSHIIQSGFVDGNGQYHYICSVESEYDSSNLSWEPTIGSAVAKLAENVGEGEEPFPIITICFDEIISSEDYENSVRYYTFEPTGTERDDIYRNVFEAEGLPLYEYGELMQMIKEKEQRLGITHEMKTDAELSWTSIE